MCFDLDSRPPIPPIAGAAVDGERIHLQAPDGTKFLCFDAKPSDSTGAGVVILPDVRGVHRFYEELALRFAERGIDSIAVDYFGRTAPNDDRGEDFDYKPHIDAVKYENVMADTGVAVEHLRARGVRHVFTMGFCFGGRLSFLCATRPELGLAGVIGFYGWPAAGTGRGGSPSPTELASQFRAPVLGLFGGADEGIPQDVVSAFASALDEAGVDNEIVTYPDAPHSFFDRKAAAFQAASEDAWVKVLEFIERYAPVEEAAA
jgi:carboxymethylenebutenolidase